VHQHAFSRMTIASNLGFARIGLRRELKTALERFWSSDLDQAGLEAAAAALHPGMVVSSVVPAHPGRTFNGTISALNVAIDPGSRAMSIEVKFANGDGRLMPGMFGSAEVQLPAKERGVFVPESAVAALPNGESFAVYAVDDGAVRVRVVQPGERQHGMVRVLAGLEPGIIVATSNLNQLFEGARVQTATPAAASEPVERREPKSE
jgi:membrane fusion protein (multidrug efflux system)